jgi:Ran GTPase-activating protein (RanGAP) involved in mRNA processing and transport
MNDPAVDATLLSMKFLEICAKVRNNDPSLSPNRGKPFRFPSLSENEGIKLADALLENKSVTYLELDMDSYTIISAEAMAEYLRASKCLQSVSWPRSIHDHEEIPQSEEILCRFLSAFQESTSLKELDINFPRGDGPSNLAFENMLTHTQSLRSLTLVSTGTPGVLLEDKAVATARSGLERNTTLRELTLEFTFGNAAISPLLTSLYDHPHLRKLCLRGDQVDLTGLETLLLSDTSKITEVDISAFQRCPMGLTRVLRALARRPTLTKLVLQRCPLGREEARLLGMVLHNTLSLHTLTLTCNTLESAGLAELAPALYRNTSIKELNLSYNGLDNMACAEILRDIIRRNKTLTTLNLSGNTFGRTNDATECIADGLGSNSTLREIDLSSCALGDNHISVLARTMGSRNTPLQKLSLGDVEGSTGSDKNVITSVGLGVLLEESGHLITDLDLQRNPIGNEGARLLARALGDNALPNLTRLSLSQCGIGDDGFLALVSALEQNISLLELDLSDKGYQSSEQHYLNLAGSLLSERAFLALAESLPQIKVLQRVDFDWCTGLASAMPLLLAGLCQNTSLYRFYVPYCAPSALPPTPEDTARLAGGWMQEMERVGYRNCFLPLIRAPEERLPPCGIWPHALARTAILPDVIFEVLRSKPSLVPSEEVEGKEAANNSGLAMKRKRGDE